jgi:hypothetical protein
MIDGIHTTTPAPNAFPNVDNTNDVGQKNQEQASDLQTEETSNVNSTGKAEHNEKSSDTRSEETDHMESAQSGHETDEESPAAQDELRGAILDILG